MTAPGFTPGPWRFGHYGDGERCWVGPDYDRPIVADVPRSVEADARLIAAAPELFEALQALLGPFPGAVHEAARARREAEERARVVLAKAGGRSLQDSGRPRPDAASARPATAVAQPAAAIAQPGGSGRTGTDRDRLRAFRGASRAEIPRLPAGMSRRSPSDALPAETG